MWELAPLNLQSRKFCVFARLSFAMQNFGGDNLCINRAVNLDICHRIEVK